MANFTPIKTIESKVATIPVGEGKFIFCTDTGNIYIDAAYGTATVVRRQGFPKHVRQPVELVFEAGAQSGLDMIGDINDPIIANTIVFVKEVEAYFYFDATSEAEPNGETIIKPEYIASGAGRWIGFTTNGITPHIDESTGNWFLGLVNTGKPSRGASPTISNGYWYIDGVNTNVKAEGTDGEDGATPSIINGNWYIDGVNTNVKAEGTDGEDGLTPTIVEGYWHIGAINTGIKAEAVDGEDGTIVTIQENYWYLNGAATGVKALGEDGVTPTIDPSSKHWMLGAVDTGIVAQGTNGTNGTVVTINPTSKNWYLNGTDTGVKAEGVDGVGLNFRGEFNVAASPTYSKTGTISDTVVYEGSMWAYIGAAASNNTPPTLPTTSNDYWTLIPISANTSGSGIPIIMSLKYNPEYKDAIKIVTSTANLNGNYIIVDINATGTNRQWIKRDIFTGHSGFEGARIAGASLNYKYDSYLSKHVWYIARGEFYEGTFQTGMGNNALRYESDEIIEDPLEIDGVWVATDEMNMTSAIENVTLIKIPDSAENQGLKSIGATDSPIEHGSLYQVLSENCIYRFDATSTVAEDDEAIIRPEYINITSAGRWIKNIIFPNNTDNITNLGYNNNQIVLSMNKYTDADVYLPFENNSITNYGKCQPIVVEVSPNSRDIKYDKSPYGGAIKNGNILIQAEYLPSSMFTIEFWFKTDTTNINILDSQYWNFDLRLINGKMNIVFHQHYQASIPVANPVQIHPNEWYHIAYVCDTESRLYVNGVSCTAPYVRTARVGHTFYEYSLTSDRNYWISDLAFYLNKAKYTSDFYPIKLPIYKQTYSTYIPQVVPDYLVKAVDQLLDTYKFSTEYTYNITPGIHYIVKNAQYPTKFPCVDFSNIDRVAILNIYYLGGTMPTIDNCVNDFTADNAPTVNKMNVYKLEAIGIKPTNTYVITKLAEYTPTGFIVNGYNTEHNFFVNNYNLLSNFDDITYDSHLGYAKYFKNTKSILNNRQIPDETGILFNSTLTGFKESISAARDLFTSVFSNPVFETGWLRCFINAAISGTSDLVRLGVYKNILTFSINGGNINMFESEEIWKQFCMTKVDVPGDYGNVRTVKIFGITQTGKVYTFNRASSPEEPWLPATITSLTLFDDTRNWNQFATGFDSAITDNAKPLAIVDNKILCIDVHSETNNILEVDSIEANNIIVNGLSAPDGIYVPNGTNIWVTGAVDGNGKYPYYIMECTIGTFIGKWIISDIDDFTGLEEYEINYHIYAYSENAISVLPIDSTWQFGMAGGGGGMGGISVLAGNAKWLKVAGSMLQDEEAYNVALAIDTSGRCYSLKYDTGAIVSQPLKDENGTDITSTGWYIKNNLNPTYILNKTSNILYKVLKINNIPSVKISAAGDKFENVVNYHMSGYIKAIA